MERKAFQLLHDAENSWWYQGRANVIRRVLKKFINSHTENICDVGAGFGGMLAILKVYGKVTAQELDYEAQASCSRRGYDEVLNTTEPFGPQKNTYSLIAAFDVLEHTPDDRAFLNTLNEALSAHGKLILTVPAFQFLWSEHDVSHHHYRRYSKGALILLLEKSGFTVRYASYWNMILFFPAAIIRLKGRSGEGSLSMPLLLDRLFYGIVCVESLIIPLLRLPFGTGIVLFAEKR